MGRPSDKSERERTGNEELTTDRLAPPLEGVAIILEAIAGERQTRQPRAAMAPDESATAAAWIRADQASVVDTTPVARQPQNHQDAERRSQIPVPAVSASRRPSRLRRLPLVGKLAWWVHALCKAPGRIRDLNNYRMQAETDRRILDDGLARLGRELAAECRRNVAEFARIAGLVAPLAQHVDRLQAAVASQDGRLNTVVAQGARVDAELESLRRLLADQQTRLHATQTGLMKQGKAIDEARTALLDERLRSDEQRDVLDAQRLELTAQRQMLTVQHDGLEAQRTALAGQVTAWQQLAAALGEQQQALAEQQVRLHEQEGARAAQAHAAEEQVARMQRHEASLAEQRGAVQASELRWQQAVQDIESRQRDAAVGVRGALQQVQARLGVPQPDGAAHDDFYSALEEQFRGTFEDIKERQRRYLTVVETAQAGTPSRPVLDLGCGRGEWLQLLQEQGLAARGIDCNDTVLSGCRKRGLAVETADLFEHLAGLAAGSVGALTAFHVVEHLPVESLLRLLGEAVRVLAPGGAALFETPNPANLLVAGYSFHLDPSHRTPLPGPLLRFMAEHQGLERVEVEDLHPVEGIALPAGDPLHPYLAGPQDYVVIGWRAGAAAAAE